ncbi:MAG: NusG domain II-containing protein [Lachnospiraceae bacterium]|nr:NusG domain II-containing protein [Lachnospiraceae bacterium]
MFGYDKIDADKKHRIRKADICFVLAILAVALVSFLIIKLQSTKGSYAEVSYDGEAMSGQILLGQPEPVYYLLTYEKLDKDISMQEFSEKEWESVSLPDTEYNVFICSNNEIRMLQSSCPDKICVNHSAISNTGENIICLPHKLVIEIKGGKENDLDGVAY